jgi:hypothetical protein
MVIQNSGLQPTPVNQPTPVSQPTPVNQPTPVIGGCGFYASPTGAFTDYIGAIQRYLQQNPKWTVLPQECSML